MSTRFTTSEVISILGIKPHRLSYAIEKLKVCTPQKFGQVRSYSQEDLRKLAIHFSTEAEVGSHE